jgi:hypothetical protein
VNKIDFYSKWECLNLKRNLTCLNKEVFYQEILIAHEQKTALNFHTKHPSWSFNYSFHWHVQNAKIACRSQDLLPFLSVIYFFQPPLAASYSSILPHFILPSISWSYVNFFNHTKYVEQHNYKMYIQGDKKSLCTWWLQYRKLHVMFNVSHASFQTFIDTRLTLMPSVIPNSNYVIMVSDCNFKIFLRVFCTVIIRCTENFDHPLYLWCIFNIKKSELTKFKVQRISVHVVTFLHNGLMVAHNRAENISQIELG